MLKSNDCCTGNRVHCVHITTRGHHDLFLPSQYQHVSSICLLMCSSSTLGKIDITILIKQHYCKCYTINVEIHITILIKQRYCKCYTINVEISRYRQQYAQMPYNHRRAKRQIRQAVNELC